MAAFLIVASNVTACSILGEISPVVMLRDANLVVRAIATDYAVPPTTRQPAQPDSRVRFKVLETIKGRLTAELQVAGLFVPHDEFNDRPSPYDFVRPSGRYGWCYTYEYRQGAQYLLFLKKNDQGQYITNWYPLGPANEQLHSDRDPWLLWTREAAHKAFEADHPQPALRAVRDAH